jgi:hypothetical protein
MVASVTDSPIAGTLISMLIAGRASSCSAKRQGFVEERVELGLVPARLTCGG